MNPDHQPRIFISYARSDDEAFVKQLYQDLTEHSIGVWWDREKMDNRGFTFLQEIRDAIENCDRVIAVIGPSAVKSDYVRAEWQHALLFAKGIVPILRQGNYNLVPQELSKLHCPDCRAQRPYNEILDELLRILTELVPPLGAFLTEVPSLPPHYLASHEDISHLAELVLADIQRPTVITSAKQTTALQGMGGIGKSVLAAAFARATDTRRACSDGVIWLTAGLGADPLTTLRLLGIAFHDSLENYLSVERARAHLPEVLADKVCLIVLDDVWDITQVTPLKNAIGPRCRLLFTTRDGGLVSALGAQEVSLGTLDDESALTLLANWVEKPARDLPAEAQTVTRECGNLPFALALCGAMVRDGILWADLIDALHSTDLRFIERQLPNYPYPDVLRSLKISIDALDHTDPIAANLYKLLAVFVHDTPVPEDTIATLWLHYGAITEPYVRKLISTFERKALLQVQGVFPARRISLHDLQADYLRASNNNLLSLNNYLLDAYAERCPGGWSTGPDDNYFFQNLSYHLMQAGRKEKLCRLLLDIAWLQAKLEATDLNSLLVDYALVDTDSSLKQVESALRLSAHVLTQDKAQLRPQLYGRLSSYPATEVQDFCCKLAAYNDKPWLRPLSQSLIRPGEALERTITDTSYHPILKAALALDRHQLLVSSGDMLKLWDIFTARKLREIKTHELRIGSIAITPNGRYALIITDSEEWDLHLMCVAATKDLLDVGRNLIIVALVGTDLHIRIFDASGKKVVDKPESELISGEILTALKERLNPFPDEFSLSKEDKQEIIRNATSIAGHTHSESNQSLEVYEFEIGSKVKAIQCGVDKITAAAIGPNGQIALTGTSTGVVAFWDLKEGAVLSQMPSHKDRIVLVAVSLDGKRAISGASDGTVVLWDCETASAVRSLNVLNDAEEYAVGHLAASPDCRFLGVGMSGSLRLLDLQTDAVPKEIQCRDYLGIQTMDISADGKNVLTCSLGGRLTLWNSETGMEPKSLKAHIAYPALARFTSDPSYAVSAAMDATIKLWNLKSNFNSQITQGHSSVVTAVVACADERHLVSGSMDGTLKLWDLKSVLEVDTVQEAADEHGYRDRITALAMASNGQYAVYAVRDRGLELRIFKRLFKRHKKSDRFAEETEVWIAKRWELKLGSKVWALIPWHSKWDKKLVNFSNIDTLHKMLQHVKNHFAKIKKERPHHLFSFYPVDMYLDLLVIELITGKSGIEKIKELDKYTYAMLWGFVRYVLDYHHEPITALALDRKGERLVTASEDTTLKVWDLNPGRLLHTLEGHSDSITDVQLMPDQEHAVSSSNDGTVKLWSLSSDQPLRDLQGHTGGVNAVVVTQNGQYVISGSDDHTIKVWNVDTHAEMCCYELHSGGVLALAVSPNGRYVISSSRDRTVKLWDLMSGQVVASFMGDGLVTACTFSQDGLIVIAGEQSGQMHFLRLQGIQ